MAPPRQRGTNIDDSRSEASSGPRERQAAGAKARRLGNVAVVAAANKDVKSARPAAAAGDEQGAGESPGINWSTMPLPVLHQYRYVHNLPCPSSFSSHINSILLSQGVGLRSPTAIAIRNAQRAASKSNDKHKTTSQQQYAPFSPPTRPSSSSAARKPQSKGHTSEGLNLHRTIDSGPGPGPAQGRVSKEHLASAVRKHFNNTAISEQDAIARFIYKVSEDRKGKAFRLKFQP